jgi:AcrR family transcriptional regulator
MNQVLSNIHLQVNEKIYLKSPDTSDLGKKIIKGSLDLIDDLGFEHFTFKKLALKISTTEASIYRYFENKNMILLYLINWYWLWVEHRVIFYTANIDSPLERLNRSIDILTENVKHPSGNPDIDARKLNRIIISESSKAFLTKQVDIQNRYGYFSDYKRFVNSLSSMILELNASYKYPNMLISTIIEGIHHQRFFAEHLPKLTDVVEGEDAVAVFYKNLLLKTIQG